MELDRQERADTLYTVADSLLSLGSNYAPSVDEIYAHVDKIEGPLFSIPTSRLKEMLSLAAQKFAPKAPTAPAMLAAWKEVQAGAQRATFTEIEAANIAAGRDINPNDVPDEMPRAVAIHKKIGLCIVCDCEPEKRRHFNGFVDVPHPARLDPPNPGGKVFWRCGRNQCGFLVDATNEKAVRAAAVEPYTSGLSPTPSPIQATAPTAPQKSRLGMFADECDVDFLALNMEQRKVLQQFCKWCDSQKPPVRVTPATYGQCWEQWQFETASEVAA